MTTSPDHPSSRPSSTGRYDGATTSKPLPFDDASIDALPRAARDELALHWSLRAASEWRVGKAFAFVADTLVEAGAPDALVALARRAVDDENRHRELAQAVASRYAGHAVDDVPEWPLEVPAHAGATVAFRRTLHVVGQCALNETFASAVLERALAQATGALAHAAIRELLADEVDHARIGWGFLASRPSSEKALLAPWLVPMVAANVRMWRAADRHAPSDEALLAHGAISPTLVDEALAIALRDLVVPGFAHVGVDTAPLAAWVDEATWQAVPRSRDG